MGRENHRLAGTASRYGLPTEREHDAAAGSGTAKPEPDATRMGVGETAAGGSLRLAALSMPYPRCDRAAIGSVQFRNLWVDFPEPGQHNARK